jgi:DNA polymerase-1
MSEVTKEERSYDKAVTFGITYGRSEKSIAETYGLTEDFVKNFITTYFDKLKQIKKWRDKQKKLSRIKRENGEHYLQSKTGRRRHFHAYEWIFSEEMKEVYARKKRVEDHSRFSISLLQGTMERQAINFPIQSYASDLLSMATARVRKQIRKEKLDAFLVLTVHDMAAVDSSDKDVKRAAEIIDQEMPFEKVRTLSNGEKLRLKFPVDYEITDHWEQ